MAVLLLSLTGPYQSWGLASRFSRRDTHRMPTKSAVIGLLASAQGRSREDPIEDLAELRFAVRADQPGVLIRDFQTERALTWQKNAKDIKMPITYRFYLCDAAFLVALSATGSTGLKVLKGLCKAVNKPHWPLYLGRRSCPPSPPVDTRLLTDQSDPIKVLKHAPWIASQTYRYRHEQEIKRGKIRLDISADAEISSDDQDYNQILTSIDSDQPISFSVRHRRYATRRVIHTSVALAELDPGNETLPKDLSFDNHKWQKSTTKIFSSSVRVLHKLYKSKENFHSPSQGHRNSGGACPAFTDGHDPMGF